MFSSLLRAVSLSNVFAEVFRTMATDIEDTDEFKWAVKVVIRRQLRDLVKQLQDYGDEVAILSVNTSENMFTHFGTSNGEWFISEQRNLVSNFLNFCKRKTEKTKRCVPLEVNEERLDQSPLTNTSLTVKAKKETSRVSDPVDEVLDIYIPDNLVGEISSLDVECLVGRLVASIMSGSEESGKYSVTRHSGNGVIPTPTISRSGRRIKPRIKDGDSSPVRGHQSSEPVQDFRKLLSRLESIDAPTLQKVKIKVGKGQFSSVLSTPVPDSEELETLAVYIKSELETLDREKGLCGRQQIKVIITIGEDDLGSAVKVGLVKSFQPVEEIPNGESHEEDDLGFINEDIGEEEPAYEDMGSEDAVNTKMEVDDPDYKPAHGIKELKPAMPPTLAERMDSHQRRRSKKPKKSKKERMKLTCEHCGIEIIGACNLKSHIQYMHLKIRNAECTVCHKKFWSNGKLSIHMLDVHTRQCHNCKEYVVESEPWKDGMHNRMVRMVRCKCGEDVPVCTSLGRKIMGDEDPSEKPKQKKRGTKYACGECGKIFSQKVKCEQHARCHMEITDYICDHCGVSFKYQASLKKHLQNEHRIMHYMCETCGKAYSSKDSLRVHIAKTHNDVKLHDDYDIDKNVAMTVARAEMILATNTEEIVQAENVELDLTNLEEIVTS